MELGGDRVYLAAMRPFGREGEERVKKHRAQRAGKGFQTVECYEGFESVADDPRIAGATVLLECLGNVVANDLFSEGESMGAVGVADAIGSIARTARHLVVVGNEVGGDGVEYSAETREYQRVLGAVARDVAQRSDLVIECVAGCPVVLKQGGSR